MPNPILLTKLLITGGSTVHPAPRTPQASESEAVLHARYMLAARDFKQDSVIIWKPCLVVRRSGVTRL